MADQPKHSNENTAHQQSGQENTHWQKGLQPRQMSRTLSRDITRFSYVENHTSEKPEQFAQLKPGIMTFGVKEPSGVARKTQNKEQYPQHQILQKKNRKESDIPENNNSNSTGLPENLKSGIEHLSGHSMDDVRVYRNSNKPSEMNALAYAQGTDIHLGPGQEKHLPHEAWHVIQQKEGRVKPTKQLKSNISINDDAALEKEADEMGNKAMQFKVGGNIHHNSDVNLYNKNSPHKILQKVSGQDALDQIAPQQAVYEFAAHHLVYKPENSGLTEQERNFLTNNGYEASESGISWIGRSSGAQLGFQAVLIKSRSEKNDILAIRGTIPGGGSENLMTIYVDLDPRAVGLQQFEANRNLIEAILSRADGPVDVTGHSLGGAMAQHTAVNFSGQVANVSTFQSPGIDQASVDRFQKIPESERPKAIHHIVTGDIVDKAGEANLPGTTYEHDFGRHLDVNILIDSLSGHIETIKESISNFDRNMAEVLSIIRPQFKWPREAAEDVIRLRDIINKLNENQAAVGREVNEIKSLLADTVSGIAEAHATHVFSSSHYSKMREASGAEQINNIEMNKSHHSTVSSSRAYPHDQQRKVAEPLRQNLGGKVQGILHAYITVVETYEETVIRYNRFKQGASDAWEGFKDGVTNAIDDASNRIYSIWNWITQ
ncbi:hypothetical protein GCM10011506_11700 [Marivirga lumbricoides]|uniref:eCIS core domain-containing protein n=1 Tax=Marivirga lumbricoides TaxID=1046115 RepID=A0ABQ1LQ49_9BACT|nr:hypothetical protein GCM10011506_11700 [Marivirga lumbricoides]